MWLSLKMRSLVVLYFIIAIFGFKLAIATDAFCRYQADGASDTSSLEEDAHISYCTLRNSVLCLVDSGQLLVKMPEAAISAINGLDHVLADLNYALCSAQRCNHSRFLVDHPSASTHKDFTIPGPTAIIIPDAAQRMLQRYVAYSQSAPFGVHKEFAFAMSIFGAWRARIYESKLVYTWGKDELEPSISTTCSGFYNAYVFEKESEISAVGRFLLKNLLSSCPVNISWEFDIATAIQSIPIDGGKICFEEAIAIGPSLRPFQGTYDAMRYFEALKSTNKMARRAIEVILFLSRNTHINEDFEVPQVSLANSDAITQYLAPKSFGRQIFHIDIRSLPVTEQTAVLDIAAMTIILGNLDEALTPLLTSTSLRPGSSVIEIVPSCRAKSSIFEDAALTSGLLYFRYILAKHELSCSHAPSHLNVSYPMDQLDVCSLVFVSNAVKQCCNCPESPFFSADSTVAPNQSFVSNNLVIMHVTLDAERFYPTFEAATDVFGW
jgi:hypothetical protein